MVWFLMSARWPCSDCTCLTTQRRFYGLVAICCLMNHRLTHKWLHVSDIVLRLRGNKRRLVLSCVSVRSILYTAYTSLANIYTILKFLHLGSKLPIFVKNSRPLSALQTVSLSACSWSSINLPGITLGLIMAHNLYRNRKPISLARIRNLI